MAGRTSQVSLPHCFQAFGTLSPMARNTSSTEMIPALNLAIALSFRVFMPSLTAACPDDMSSGMKLNQCPDLIGNRHNLEHSRPGRNSRFLDWNTKASSDRKADQILVCQSVKKADRLCFDGVHGSPHISQIFRTNRWETTAVNAGSIKEAWMPISVSRTMAEGASLVCKVLSTRCPVKDSFKRIFSGFLIADLAHHNNIRRLSNNMAQSCAKCQASIRLNSNLVKLISLHQFDRIFNRCNINGLLRKGMQRRIQRSCFAAPDRAGDKNHSTITRNQ